MKAAQIVAPRQIEIIDIDQPDISADPEGTVLISVGDGHDCARAD